jgi:hypothetical protein
VAVSGEIPESAQEGGLTARPGFSMFARRGGRGKVRASVGDRWSLGVVGIE